MIDHIGNALTCSFEPQGVGNRVVFTFTLLTESRKPTVGVEKLETRNVVKP